MDDYSILDEMIGHGRAAESWFHDENDPEVDRLFNSSPPLIEQVATYELDSVFGYDAFQYEVNGSVRKGRTADANDAVVKGKDGEDDEDDEDEGDERFMRRRRRDDDRDSDSNGDDDNSSRARSRSNDVESVTGTTLLNEGREGGGDNEASSVSDSMNAHQVTTKTNNEAVGATPSLPEVEVKMGDKQTNKSALTILLQTSSSAKPEDGANALRLTIYLPDYSALKVNVSNTSTIEDTIKKVLSIHEERNLSPPLEYGKTGVYELCMHEGDGEPDRDFTLQKSHKIKNYYNPSKPDVNEYCLCETEESMRESSARASLSRGRSGTLDSLANQPPNTIMVTIPSSQRVGNIFLPFSESTTMRDILFAIAEMHRINLLTDHFCFRISSEDQNKFKLMAPVITLDTRIQAVGVRKFELEKKLYEDASRVFLGERAAEMRSSKAHQNTNRGTESQTRKNSVTSYTDHINKRKSIGVNKSQPTLNNSDTRLSALAEKDSAELAATRKHEPEKVEFTNPLTAAGYQEWNIVKKNKYGIKHPRVLGIDGQYIYNYKRGERRGNSGVTTATRDVKRIIRVTANQDNKKAFRITFHGDGAEIYDIEYICERMEERPEIIGKLKVLIMPSSNPIF